MSKTAVWTIIVIVIIALGVWFWASHKSANAPVASQNAATSVQNDTAASMQSDLNGVSIQDPNFQNIDQGVNSL